MDCGEQVYYSCNLNLNLVKQNDMDETPEKDYLTDVTQEANFGYKLASPADRLGAVFLEGIITHLPLYFILGSNSPYFGKDVYDLTALALQTGLAALLGAIFYSLWSANLGHRILGLKVISAVDGRDQKNPGIGAVREGLKHVLGLAIIPSIWLLWDPKNQNLYDKIIGTLVVRNNPN